LFFNLALEKWISRFTIRPLNSIHQPAVPLLSEVAPFIRVVFNVNNMLDKYLSTTHVYHVWDTFWCKFEETVSQDFFFSFLSTEQLTLNPDTGV
jgi:hypothetical protein